MGDYISREAALKVFCEWCGVCPEEARKPLECDDILWNVLRNLPAAEVNPVRWIPVDEQLPEEYRSVLVCFMSQGGMAQSVSERFDGNRWSALCGFEPVAWMPLPEPPNCGVNMRKDKQE